MKRKADRTLATPTEAKSVWESLGEGANIRTVADKLTASGKKVSFKTIAKWKNNGWTRKAGPTAIEAATAKLDAAVPVLTGDPTSKAADLPKKDEKPGEPKPSDVLSKVTDETSTSELVDKVSRDALLVTKNVLAHLMDIGALALATPEGTGKLLLACVGSIDGARNNIAMLAPLREAEMRTVNGVEIIPPTALTLEQRIAADPLRASLEAMGKALGEPTA